MKMRSEKRAIDKVYKRRDRYEIPDWQRGEVWSTEKKQRLIDSILRGWKLPKFYFVRVSEETLLVEDGQQRLNAIWEFFSNELELGDESDPRWRGKRYKELSHDASDAFDDFEIEFDIIEASNDEELKEFFQRLQEGMPLTSSEKLNAVHSKLRDFCSAKSKHKFFSETIAIQNTRYAHFDIVAKVAAVEIEGLETGLRFDDIREVFEAQREFASSSAVGKRITKALDVLQEAFRGHGGLLKTRAVVQSLVSLTCRLVSTGRFDGHEKDLREFFARFLTELAEQVELGQLAYDADYLTFQRSVNANLKGAAETRVNIMLRKMFRISPSLADILDPSVVLESGLAATIGQTAVSIGALINTINVAYASKHGEDLFKATNKTSQALGALGKPIRTLEQYEAFIDEMYFIFRESIGTRLQPPLPQSFVDVNTLRTEIRHDVDHGDAAKVRAKRKKAGTTFAQYAGAGVPETVAPEKFVVAQSNLLAEIQRDLRTLVATL
jgi:hypothetical protein